MSQVLAIAIGGAAGAVMRYWVSTAVYAWLGRGFPWGTLAVNVLGSLAMGFLAVWLLERLNVPTEVRLGILVGFLGAFTTFSTFAMETFNLWSEGAWMKVLANIIISVVLCVLAAALGVAMARRWI